MNEMNLSNWKLCPSEKLNFSGEEISAPNLNLDGWYLAKVPSTVLSTLVDNGVYKDPYFGKNLNKIPTEQFRAPWWYRTEFELSADEVNNIVHLSFNGINYKANIWLNGILIADAKIVSGAYRRFKFNISEVVNSDKNFLAAILVNDRSLNRNAFDSRLSDLNIIFIGQEQHVT